MAARLAGGQDRGEVALITGGSQGLGFAAAYALAQAGVRIAIVGRSAARLRDSRVRLERRFKRPVLGIRADLAARGAARRVATRVLATLGRIDTVVAAAGDVPVGSLSALNDNAWHEAFGAKLLGHVALFREVASHMRARGTGLLIAVTGATGHEPSPENIAAGAVNAALQNVMKALATDLGPAGIRVLSVSPGPFLTRRLRRIAHDQGHAGTDSTVIRRFSKEIPLGRVGQPSELGALVQFLHSSGADFLHGTTIVIDGGKKRSV